MTAMRVTATVVGNTLVVDDSVELPEGTRVEVDFHVVEGGEGVVVDEETVAELEQALKEADAGDFVSEEEVWARIEARYGK
jgi:predicted transcriptional regulator